MTVKAKALLDKCLEIEGLLSLLMQREGKEIPEQLFQLLEEKSETLYMEIGELRSIEPSDSAIELLPNVNDIESEADTIEDFVAPKPEILTWAKEIEPVVSEYSAVIEDEIETQPEIEINSEEPEVIFDVNVTSKMNEEIIEAENQEELIKEEPVEIEGEESISFQIKLSLNDRYRFRRELFNFSDEEMDEALEALSAMSSVEEVEDYFYNDLCWEPDDEVVREFMGMITTVTNR